MSETGVTVISAPAPSPPVVVIVGAARTAQGRMLGALASKSAVDLGSTVIRAALEHAGVDAAALNHVIMSQVVQAGAGQNPAKQAAVAAGVPVTVPAVTVNKVCLSGLDAVISASRLLRLGDAEVVVAGGQESMSNAPHLAAGVRTGAKFGSLALHDSLERDGLTDPVHGTAMGVETEEGNTSRGITRVEQDRVAALSHQRAEAAIAEGTFAAEIAPVEITGRKGTVIVDTDEGVRPGTTEESLASLRPAFAKDGTITAASASQISDGAVAAVVLTTRAYAEANGLEVLAALGAYGQTAGPVTFLHSQPSQGVAAALVKAERSASDLDFLEINEAFGAVVQSIKDLDYPLERTNIHGGGIVSRSAIRSVRRGRVWSSLRPMS